jgi:signal transduction histidine kinase
MTYVVVSMALLAFSHIICFSVMSERKYTLRKTVLIYTGYFAGFICVVCILAHFFGVESMITAFLGFFGTIISAFVIFMLMSADAARKKIFLFISYSSVFCIFFCISVIAGDAFFADASAQTVMYARSIIRIVLYIPYVFLYVKYLRPIVRKVPGSNKKAWYSLSLTALLFLIAFTMLAFDFYDGRDEGTLFRFAIISMIYCAVLIVAFSMIHYMIEEIKAKLIEKNVEYLQNQLEFEKENEILMKTIRHDYRHHARMLAEMIKNGDTEGALGYIEKYSRGIEASAEKELCANPTVNAILNVFCDKARSLGIRYEITVDTAEDTDIENIDFVAILSNLLENAVNGCVKCGSGGEIKVSIRRVERKTVIVCSNPCLPELKIENDMIKEKGTGIESMLLAARRYGGDIHYKKEEDILTACVILNAC